MSIASATPLPVLLLTALAALVVSGCTISLDLDDDAIRRVETETIDVDGLARIDVTTGNGAVEVVTADVATVTVRAELEESDAGDADFTVETIGDRLVVRGECDRGWFDRCQVGFHVTVPADLDVDVTTDNGRIVIDGVDGELSVETDNGAIDATALTSDAVVADTDNGRIQIGFAAAPESVRATTDNGAIDIVVPPTGERYDVDARSDNGAIDIDVDTEASAAHRIVVDTDNGAIDVAYAG